MEDVSFPLSAGAEVVNPNGPERFQFHPQESCCWLRPDYGMQRQGNRVLGQTSRPPMPATDALARWIVPKHRGALPGLTVLDLKPLP